MPNARELAQHVGHDIRVVMYSSEDVTYDTSIKCEDCSEVLYDAEWGDEDD
jgi:hypothetical protein